MEYKKGDILTCKRDSNFGVGFVFNAQYKITGVFAASLSNGFPTYYILKYKNKTVNSLVDVVHDYFYSPKELRKLKLRKINEKG